MPEVSVVIPTHNRLSRLKQILTALKQQNIPLDDFEVIVVSDGSKDGTGDYLNSLVTPFPLRFIPQASQGAAVARNCGVEHASGDIILFIDDDVVPTPRLISEHLRFHNQYGDRTVVIGPMITPPGYKMSPWVQWEQAMLVKQYGDMVAKVWAPTARQFYTGNTSLGRRHLISAGGFDPSFRRAEDVELAYRLTNQGLSFVFNPQAVGYHYAERSFTSWIKIPYAYGVNDVIFTVHKDQGWLLPAILREYQLRHKFTKSLVMICLDRPLLSRSMIMGLRLAAQLSDKFGQNILSILACGGIFNLCYFQGIADQLGGRGKFYARIKATHAGVN